MKTKEYSYFIVFLCLLGIGVLILTAQFLVIKNLRVEKANYINDTIVMHMLIDTLAKERNDAIHKLEQFKSWRRVPKNKQYEYLQKLKYNRVHKISPFRILNKNDIETILERGIE